MSPTEDTTFQSRHHEAVRSKQTRRDAIRHYLGYRDAVKNRQQIRLKKATTIDLTKVEDQVRSSSPSQQS